VTDGTFTALHGISLDLLQAARKSAAFTDEAFERQ
jgi:hypothetical protein